MGRDLEAQRHVEGADQIEDHLAARRRRLVVPVQRAVEPVAGVVIDVDQELSLEPLRRPSAPRSLHSITITASTSAVTRPAISIRSMPGKSW